MQLDPLLEILDERAIRTMTVMSVWYSTGILLDQYTGLGLVNYCLVSLLWLVLYCLAYVLVEHG